MAVRACAAAHKYFCFLGTLFGAVFWSVAVVVPVLVLVFATGITVVTDAAIVRFF